MWRVCPPHRAHRLPPRRAARQSRRIAPCGCSAPRALGCLVSRLAGVNGQAVESSVFDHTRSIWRHRGGRDAFASAWVLDRPHLVQPSHMDGTSKVRRRGARTSLAYRVRSLIAARRSCKRCAAAPGDAARGRRRSVRRNAGGDSARCARGHEARGCYCTASARSRCTDCRCGANPSKRPTIKKTDETSPVPAPPNSRIR